MKIDIHHRCTNFNSYRAASIKSLFNVDSGANFTLSADIPLEDDDWQIGVVVGPSGTGKTSIGKACWPDTQLWDPLWSKGKALIDGICPNESINKVTAALAAVGLGSVPTWLRPVHVLSNGEQFRANLAKLVWEAPDKAIIDEFSSVVDRQIAQIGAGAFAKSWRRTKGQAILLSCHYDILPWVEPDWVFDTATGELSRRSLRRPSIELSIHQTNWRLWPLFEPHHYLKLPHMIAATNYVGTVNGELVAHIAFSTRPGLVEARACRLVIMPEWQGAGIGLKFLDHLCDMWLKGNNRYNKPMPTLFHTSHPGLAAILRRSNKWTQISAVLHGGNKERSRKSLGKSGYGGHFRAVQGFRYLGTPNP
ncbi:MAG: ABC transporter ATP-binding protein [Oceanospirillaceae bacterium]|nr:ABC transporter ATP-binding protein [Oceanospirillaceae bacterium]